MRRRLNTLGLGLILLAFVSHWAIIVVGVGRDNPLRQAMTSVLDVYYHKLFYQRWRLFAPEPSTASKKFYYRCHSDGEWSPWQDPIAPLLEKHYRYRVSHHGKELRIPIRPLKTPLNVRQRPVTGRCRIACEALPRFKTPSATAGTTAMLSPQTTP